MLVVYLLTVLNVLMIILNLFFKFVIQSNTLFWILRTWSYKVGGREWTFNKIETNLHSIANTNLIMSAKRSWKDCYFTVSFKQLPHPHEIIKLGNVMLELGNNN